MSAADPVSPLGDAFRGDRLKPTVILSCSTVLMLAWWYAGSPDFFRQWVAPRLGWTADVATAAAVYSFAACFVLLGAIPALIVRLAFRERLADYGVRLGDRRRTLRSAMIFVPACVVVAYLASHDPAVRRVYPLNAEAGESPFRFGLHALSYLTFYLGWEFHFRGFLQVGLRDRFGASHAMLVQVMASSLLHLGKPGMETFGAIGGGILWGIVAYRSRSLLSGILQHFALGIALDGFICFL